MRFLEIEISANEVSRSLDFSLSGFSRSGVRPIRLVLVQISAKQVSLSLFPIQSSCSRSELWRIKLLKLVNAENG
jgi:hypothetical protein